MTLFEEIRHFVARLLDILQFTGSWTETIINVTLLVTTLYTIFFLIYIPVHYPLRRLFKPMGFPTTEALAIAWRCRKRPALFLRFYIETVIIEGSTTHMPRWRWIELRRIFETRLEQYNRLGSFTVQSASISDIISEEKKELIRRYFDLCTPGSKRSPGNLLWRRHVRRNPEFSPEAFASNLQITNGFLAPMARITGLNDRFEQNWQSIINNYRHMTSRPETRIPSHAASLTYTWLMWGPSVQISCRHDPASSGKKEKEPSKSLGIYGCGDEANSVHIVIPAAIRDKIFANNRFCVECSVVGRLRNPRYYVNTVRTDVDPVSGTFLDRIYYAHLSTPEYIVELEQAEPLLRKADPSSHGYFTAYIWAMFCLESPSATRRFDPANAVVLFEHTNLADPDNYRFLSECLLAKIRHFFGQRPAPDHPDTPNGRYLYCCSMNDDLNRRIETLIDKDEFFGIRPGNFRLQEILETLDAHYITGHLQIIPERRYPDVIRLNYVVNREKEMQRLCDLLADKQLVVVGSENEKRELCAVGILRGDQSDRLAFCAIAPRAHASENELLEFALHVRDSRTTEEPIQ